jgi:hypothetical protein
MRRFVVEATQFDRLRSGSLRFGALGGIRGSTHRVCAMITGRPVQLGRRLLKLVLLGPDLLDSK